LVASVPTNQSSKIRVLFTIAMLGHKHIGKAQGLHEFLANSIYHALFNGYNEEMLT